MIEVHWLGRWAWLPVFKAARVDDFWFVSLIWGPLQAEVSSYAFGVAKVECWNLFQDRPELQALLSERGFKPWAEEKR